MLKPREIIWTKAAQLDLNSIAAYISNDSPAAAENLFEAIERSVQILPRFPLLFRESDRMPGTREIPVLGSFLVFYRVDSEAIEVIGVAHGRRKFPVRGRESR